MKPQSRKIGFALAATASLVVANAAIQPARAQSVGRREVDGAIRSGVTALLQKVASEDDKKPGLVAGELNGSRHGGLSTLTAFALLAAGVETTEPKMQLLLDVVAGLGPETDSTYVYSLRAGVWSMLLDRHVSKVNRRKYRRLLIQDIKWLKRAMRADGTYGYDSRRGRSDRSNTQFANLGLWAGAIADAQVAGRYWKKTAESWLENQHPAGGWAYSKRHPQPTPSMTVAGCNSLFIVLDRYYAQADEPYEYFKGAKPKVEARTRMRQIVRAVEDGDRFLRIRPPHVAQRDGYELFGLERLGLASGRSHIGGVDWFRQHVEPVARRTWGDNIIADSFSLIFLVHGRAPVLFQKLEHADDADDWNYYHRDLHNLTRYLSRTFERLLRWQRIPSDASLESLRDAPILFISSRRELHLPLATRRRIREYVDGGGVVFAHADRAGVEFIAGARKTFETMFADRGLRFEPLDETHPLYRCHFGAGGWKRRVPLEVISDGPRIMVLLCPVDIAGAWHQDRGKHEDLFKIMANVRVYCAPTYPRLPSVLRATPRPPQAARQRGSLSLHRLRYGHGWDAQLGVWKRQRDALARRTGIALEIDEGAAANGAKALARFDLVHLAMREDSVLDPQTRSALRDYLASGGFLLIDAAGGRSQASEAVKRVADELDVGVKDVLSGSHPIATGALPGGRPLFDLETTDTGASLNRPGAPPPIITRNIEGRLAVVACPFDLVTGLDGHFVWNRIGYRPDSTRRIVDNILLWRLRHRDDDR